MDQVARHAQGELERPQRVIGARRHYRGQDIAIGRVFGANRSRWRPGRIRRLGGDLGVGDRRTPAFTANTQREGMHHVLPFREVVQAVLGQVDDNAFTRARRQDVAGRQDDLGAGTWQPWVHARVGGDHFQVAEVVGSADIGERVLVLCLDHMHLADDVFTGRWQWQLQRSSGARYQQGGQGQATGDGRKARQHPVNPSKGGSRESIVHPRRCKREALAPCKRFR
ncbi:hypothetical protein D3C76_769360 [compost metagenome]